jgi:hypothetical protein
MEAQVHVTRQEIEHLAQQWLAIPDDTEEQCGIKLTLMNQVVHLLQRLYDVIVVRPDGQGFATEDPSSLRVVDDTIRWISHLWTDAEAEDGVITKELVKLRHEIEQSLWLQINSHQLDIFTQYQSQFGRQRKRDEIAAVVAAVPLEEVLQDMKVDRSAEEKQEVDLEAPSEGEEEGDEDEEEVAEGYPEPMPQAPPPPPPPPTQRRIRGSYA